MLEQGYGALVNISSYVAIEPSAKFPVSACIRSALSNFTKLYADQYAEHNIRMNNVLPGFLENYPTDEKILAAIPMKRAGKLKEVAKTVAFLLSPEANYITGQNIRIDGGYTRSV
jgi:NAD(P)-dependent dehydrogenase (short-subunit alcohol dehydrogenase family)